MKAKNSDKVVELAKRNASLKDAYEEFNAPVTQGELTAELNILYERCDRIYFNLEQVAEDMARQEKWLKGLIKAQAKKK
jgi:hypothetical protein